MEDKTNLVDEMKSAFGQPTALAISFDTTGSMATAIKQVRQTLRDLVEKMTQDIPNLLIGLIGHGDYCDGPNMIKALDLTNDLEAVMKFITDAPNTSGGDAPECYEAALAMANTFSWPEEGGIFILIGDATPHEVDDPQNTDNLDWQKEIEKLKARKVNVFPMQCLRREGYEDANKFWEGVAEIADTTLLNLDNLTNVSDQIEAVAYSGVSEEVFSKYEAKLSACSFTGSEEERVSRANLLSNVDKIKSYRSRKSE
jgi:hypothetical protein